MMVRTNAGLLSLTIWLVLAVSGVLTAPAAAQEEVPSPSTTVLTSAPNPSEVGQSVTLTASVTRNGVAGGTVTFYDITSGSPVVLGSQTKPSESVEPLVFSISVSFASAGIRQLLASYSGGSDPSAVTPSDSDIVFQTVNPAPTPTPTPTSTPTSTTTTTDPGQGAALQARTALVSDGDLPGLHDREPGPGSVNLSGGGANGALNYSASVAVAAGQAAESLADGGAATPFNLWVDGTLAIHARNDGGGEFAVTRLGADYLVNENLLLGAAVYLDWMRDVTPQVSVTGRAVLAGPYVSVGLGSDVALDASLFHGHSWNDAVITLSGQTFTGAFQTEQWIAKTKLEGEWLVEQFTIRPSATLFLSSETAQGYVAADQAGNTVTVAGFTAGQFRALAGVTIEEAIPLGDLRFTPQLGGRIGVVDPVLAAPLANSLGQLSAGFELAGGRWELKGSVETEVDTSGFRSGSLKGAVTGRF